MNQNSESKLISKTWLAVGSNTAALAALCEHLPPHPVIVSTRAALEAQMEACAGFGKDIVVLLDDSASTDETLAVLQTHAARIHILYLNKPKTTLVKLDAKTFQPIDKPVKINDLARLIKRLLARADSMVEIAVSKNCTLRKSHRILVNPVSGAQAELTEKEMQILDFLYHMKPDTATREQLHREVWGYQGELNTHTLETHIYRLRSKLKDIGALDVLIENAPQGYRLDAAG